MKKIFFAIAILTLVGCVPLKSDGSFGSEQFVGKFHGIEVYKVQTPDGTTLYLGFDPTSRTLSEMHKSGKMTVSTISQIP